MAGQDTGQDQEDGTGGAPAGPVTSPGAGGEPRYRQLAARLDRQIRQGLWAPGSRLPGLRAMAEREGLGINTVKAAYGLLEAGGLVECRPQSGFYVAPGLAGPEETGTAGTGPGPGAVRPGGREPSHDPAGFSLEQVSMCRVYREFQLHHGPGEAGNIGLALTDLNQGLARRIADYQLDAMQARPQVAMEYAVSPGLEELRGQLALLARRRGMAAEAGDFVVTNGCTEAITLALQTAFRPGALIGVESPCYFNLLRQILTLGYRVHEIPGGRQGLHPDTLEHACRTTRLDGLIISPAFANPRSQLMPREHLADIMELCRRHDLTVVEDDVYGELHEGDEAPVPLKALDDEGRVLYCSGFSKTISPGLRIGWCQPGRLYEAYDNLKTLSSIAAPTLGQLAVARLLENAEYGRHLRSLRRGLVRNREACVAAVQSAFPAGTRVDRPRGGLVFWVRLPDQLSASVLYRRALDERILIAPGSVFSLNGWYNDCMRLNAGIWNPGVAASLATLGRLAGELADRA